MPLRKMLQSSLPRIPLLVVVSVTGGRPQQIPDFQTEVPKLACAEARPAGTPLSSVFRPGVGAVAPRHHAVLARIGSHPGCNARTFWPSLSHNCSRGHIVGPGVTGSPSGSDPRSRRSPPVEPEAAVPCKPPRRPPPGKILTTHLARSLRDKGGLRSSPSPTVGTDVVMNCCARQVLPGEHPGIMRLQNTCQLAFFCVFEVHVARVNSCAASVVLSEPACGGKLSTGTVNTPSPPS